MGVNLRSDGFEFFGRSRIQAPENESVFVLQEPLPFFALGCFDGFSHGNGEVDVVGLRFLCVARAGFLLCRP
jgi:hypothetical protein